MIKLISGSVSTYLSQVKKNGDNPCVGKVASTVLKDMWEERSSHRLSNHDSELVPHQELITLPQIHQDLRDAPDISSFYNRTSEQATLQEWRLQ